MTKFEGGPADGKILELLRMPMPYFLRVVQAPDGTIDALDKLDDEPAKNEKIFVYFKKESQGTMHVDGRDKNGKRFGKWFECCLYAIHPEQPEDAILRGKESWPAWCKKTYEAIQKP